MNNFFTRIKKAGAVALCSMLLLIASGIKAQTPGGVGTTNLQLWLNAGNGVSTSGGVVTGWNDKSGNANNAGTVTGSGNITLTSNAINYKNALTFTGVGALQGTLGTTLTSTNVTAFIVANVGSTSSAGNGVFSIYSSNPISSDTANVSYASFLERNTATATSVSGARTNNAAALITNTVATSTDQYHFYTSIFTNGTNNKDSLSKDGLSVATNAFTATAFSSNQFTIGGRYITGFPTHGFKGNIAEVILFNSALPLYSVNRIQSYLAIKYGITLDQTTATNYINSSGTVVWNAATNANYKNNIFGLASDSSTGALNVLKASSVNTNILTVSATSLTAGSFLMISDSGTVGVKTGSGYPSSVTSIMNNTWRVSATGSQTVTITFISPLPGTPILIVNTAAGASNNNFKSSTTTYTGTLVSGNTYTFTGVTLNDKYYFTFGTASATPTASPGGVYANLRLWLNAGAGVTTSGSNVTAWADQGSFTNSATTVNGTNPVLTSNAINNNAAITFAGAGGLQGTFSSAIGTNNLTAIMVGNINNAGNSGAGAFSIATSTAGASDNNSVLNASLFERNTTNSTVGYERNGSVAAMTGSTDQYHLFANIFSNKSALDSTMREGKLITATNTSVITNFNSNLYTIGSRYTSGAAASYLTGSIAEVLLYDRELTTFELNKVQSYLAIKYGLSLDQTTAINYINSAGTAVWSNASNSNYKQNIFGIGVDNTSGLSQLKSTNASNVLTVQASSMTNGQFVMISDSGTGGTKTVSGWPSSVVTLQGTTWRVSGTALTSGTQSVTLTYVSPLPGTPILLVNTSGTVNNFKTATAYTGTLVSGNTYSFSSVTLSNGYYFTFGSATAAPTASPGGVFANLRLWLNAGTGVTGTSSVTAWADQSGNSNNASTVNGTNPALTTNAINNNAAITFAGAGGLQGSFSSNITSNNITAIMVGNINNSGVTGAGAFSIASSTTGVSDNNSMLYASLFERNLLTTTVGYERNVSIAAMTGSTDAYHLFANIFSNRSLLDSTLREGKLVGNTTSPTAPFNSNLYTIGSRYTSGAAASYLTGSIAEVLLYDRELSTFELNKVESYLAIKYGLSLDQTAAINYVNSAGTAVWSNASNTNYKQNIFGIGVDNTSGLSQLKSTNASNVLTVQASSMSNGQFVMISDSGTGGTKTVSGWPSSIVTLQKTTWRVSGTALTSGTQSVTLTYVSPLPGTPILLVNTTGPTNFKTATAYTGTLVSGNTYSFSSVTLGDGYNFTFGTATAAPTASPGGVFANLRLWLNAGTGVTGTSTVTAWADQSGNSNNASTVNGTNPALTTNAINNNAAITFAGAGGLQGSFSSSITSNNVTAIMVGNVNNSGASGAGAFSIASSTAGVSDNNSMLYASLFERTLTSSSVGYERNTSVTAMTGSTDQYHLFANIFSNRSLLDSTLREGKTVGSNTTPTAPFNSNLYTIGSRYTSGAAASYLTGSIAEVLLYDRELSTFELNKVESYLAIKYGLSLDQTAAINYINSAGVAVWSNASNTNYKQNIFGIGVDNTSGLSQSKSTNASNVLTVQASSMTNGQFVMISDSGTGGTKTVSGWPNSVVTLQGTTWRVSGTALTSGTQSVTLTYVSPLPGTPILLVNSSGPTNFKSATAYTGTLVSGSTYSFSSVTLGDGYYFTFGTTTAAPTSPGGVFANLRLWLNAGTGVTGTGSVTAWADQSGNSNNAGTVNGTNPSLSSSAINGNSALTFAGIGGLQGSFSSNITSNNLTAIMVGNINSSGASGAGAFSIATSGVSDNTNVLYASLFERNVATTAVGYERNGAVSAMTGSTDQYHLFANIFSNRSALDSTLKEGKLITSTTTPITTFNSNLFTIGSRYTSGAAASYLTGNIAEVILYDRELSTFEINKVQSYLAIKYGLSLDQTTAINYTSSIGTTIWSNANSLIYKSNIFGIGKDNGSGLNQTTSTSLNTSILTIQNPSSLTTDGFLMVSDNGLTGTSAVSGYTSGATSALNTVWRASVTGTGTVGTVDLVLVSPVASPVLLINSSSPSFSGVSAVTGTLVSGSTYKFAGVTLGNGYYFTFGSATTSTGPGGVFANLRLWLEGSTGVSTSGSNVTGWADQSLNANSASTVNGTNPTLTTNAINYNNAVSFAGTGGLQGTFGTNVTASAVTAVIVGTIKTAGASGAGAFSISASGGSDNTSVLNASLFEHNAATLTVGYERNGSVAASTTSTDQTHLFANIFCNATNADSFLREGKLIVKTTTPISTFNSSVFTIGSRYTAGAAAPYLTGTIAEAILYDRELTATELNRVQSYMAIKYGISLDQTTAINYTSSAGAIVWNASTNASYTNNIFGIGKDNGSGLNQTKSSSINTNILTIQNPSALTTGGFLMLSDNGLVGAQTVSGYPGSVTTALNTVWRVSKTGSVGTVDIVVNSTLPVTAIIIDNGSGFTSGTAVTPSSSSGNTYTFSGVTLADGYKITIGTSTIPSPGGVFTNLKLWLNANTGVATSGSTVTGWTDQSGTNSNTYLTNGTAPVLTSNGLNSNNVVTFAGTGGLQGAFTSTVTSNAVSAFVVSKIGGASIANAGAFSIAAKGVNDNTNTLYASLLERYISTTGPAYERNGQISASGSVTDQSYLFTNIFRSSNSTENFYNNGLQANSSAFTASAFNSSIYTIGSRYQSGITNFNYLTGNVAEVILYDRELSTTEQGKVQSYLAIKYGITLDQTTATNYVNSSGTTVWNATTNSAYNQNVAGIGKDNGSGLNQTTSVTVNSGSYVATIQNPSSLSNNSFLFLSNNGNTISAPVAQSGLPSSLTLISSTQWRVTLVGTVGTVDLSFYSIYSSPKLIIDNAGSLTAYSPSSTSGHNYTFTGITLADGYKVYLGYASSSPGDEAIGSMNLWLKAGSGTTISSGTSVSTWADQTGSGYTATQANSTLQPTLTSTDPNFNGNPALYFDNISASLSTNTSFTSTPYTVLAVFNDKTFLGSIRRIVNGTNVWGIGINNNTNSFYAGANVDNGTTTISDSRCIINAAVVTNAGSNNALFYNNGLNISASSGGVTASTAPGSIVIGPNLTTGVFSNPVPTVATNAFGGQIAELIYYNHSISGTALNAIQSYLAIKYGVTLDQTVATNYVNYNGTIVWNATSNASYKNNIFGIGYDSLSGLNQLTSTSINSGAVLSLKTSSLKNGNFLLMSDNGAAVNLYTTTSGLPTVSGTHLTHLMNRQWKVSKTGNFGKVTITLDNSAMAIYPAVNAPYLLVDSLNNGTYTAYAPTTVTGSTFITYSASLPDGAKVFFGTVNVDTKVSVKAYHNGTLVTKLTLGDTVHYVLEVSGGLPGAAITVLDTLSSSQSYVTNSLNAPGWTAGGGGASAWFNSSNQSTATWNAISPTPGYATMIPVYGANALQAQAIINNPAGQEILFSVGGDGFWPEYWQNNSGVAKVMVINHHAPVTGSTNGTGIYQCWNVTAGTYCNTDLGGLTTSMSGLACPVNAGHARIGNKIYFGVYNTTTNVPGILCVDLNPSGNPIYCPGYPIMVSNDTVSLASLSGANQQTQSNYIAVGNKVYVAYLNKNKNLNITYIDVSASTPAFVTPVTAATFTVSNFNGDLYIRYLNNNKFAVVPNNNNASAAAMCLDFTSWPTLVDCKGNSTIANLSYPSTRATNATITLNSSGAINGFCLSDEQYAVSNNTRCYNLTQDTVTPPLGFVPSNFHMNSLQSGTRLITGRNVGTVTTGSIASVYCYDFSTNYSCGSKTTSKYNNVYGLGAVTGNCFLTLSHNAVMTQWRVNPDSTITENATTCNQITPAIFNVPDPSTYYCDGTQDTVQYVKVDLTNLPTNFGRNQLQVLDTSGSVLENYYIPSTSASYTQLLSTSYAQHHNIRVKIIPNINFVGTANINVILSYSTNNKNPQLCFNAKVTSCNTTPFIDKAGVAGGGSSFIGTRSYNVFDTAYTTIGGYLWGDGNNNAYLNSGTEVATNYGKSFYAILTHPGNTVDTVVQVASDGSFIFPHVPLNDTGYRVRISMTNPAIGSIFTTPTLYGGMKFTGTYAGPGNQTSSGAHLGATYISARTGYCNVESQNIGVDSLPLATTLSYGLVGIIPNTFVTLNGNGTISNPGPLKGHDAEEITMGSGKTMVITSLPTNGQLWYNGVQLTHANDTFVNYNASLLQWKATGSPYRNYTTTSFNYAWIDSANYFGSIAPYTLTLTDTITVGGTVFNDGNGMTDGNVNGIGSGIIGTTQLYANLLDSNGNVIAVQTLPSSGKYKFTVLDGVIRTERDSITITTTAGTTGLPSPASSLPASMQYTGAAYGANNTTGSGNITNTNGRVGVTTFTGSVTNLNFGINRLPYAGGGAQATQDNPGGTQQAIVLPATFTNSAATTDPENKVADIKITKFPTNANSFVVGTTGYYPNAGALPGTCPFTSCVVFPSSGVTVPTNSSGQPTPLVSVDPINGPVGVVFKFVAIDSAGALSPDTGTASLNFKDVTLSGTVYHDANGTTNGSIDDIATGKLSQGTGTQVWAYLSSGTTVVDSVKVASNGTFSFNTSKGVQINTDFSVSISTSQVAPGGTTPNSLPAGWVNTAEGTGANGDGNTSPNGITAIRVDTSSISGIKFGVEETPTANAKTAPSRVNPGGTNTVSVPGMYGTDPEDGIYTQGSTFIIHTLPVNGTLYYNGNKISTADTTITNYDSTLLKVDPNNGSVTVSFTYEAIDSAHKLSAPATVTMPFSDITISGNVYDDANGLKDNTVNGISEGTIGSTQLYAYLLNSTNGLIIDSVKLPSTGAYTFSTAKGIVPNTNYIISVSSVQAAPGSIGIATLPATLVNTGENIGTGTGNDGLADGKLTVSLSTSSITNADFGIDQLSTADAKSYSGLIGYGVEYASGNFAYPWKVPLNATASDGAVTSTSNSTAPGKVSGSDPEDSKYGGATGADTATITFTSLPSSSSAVLVYDGTPLNPNPVCPGDYACTYWNSTTNMYQISQFDPSLLSVYAATGVSSVSFNYAWLDAAGKKGASALYSMSFTSPLPVQLLDFEATKQNNTSLLTWVTSTEINSSYFEIERSGDGYTYTTLGDVPAAGNSKVPLNYSSIDKQPLEGINYYRLRMVDRDNTYIYSNVRTVLFTIYGISVKAYPNPVGGNQLTIQVDAPVDATGSIGLFNVIGEHVLSAALNCPTGITKNTLDISHLPTGLYQLRIVLNGHEYLNKIEIMH